MIHQKDLKNKTKRGCRYEKVCIIEKIGIASSSRRNFGKEHTKKEKLQRSSNN